MSGLPVGIVQPDRRSCGAASLVAARMLLDPAYADLLVTGTHPGTGHTVAGGDLAARFATEVLAMHRRVTGAATLDGRLQAPWPRVIGTPPWAVAHQLSATSGPGLPATPYDARLVRLSPAAAPDRIRAGLDDGRPVALFVGDRWLPRHVVLAISVAGDSLGCYDPARGRVVAVSTSAFASTRLPFGRWTHPWFVVAPRG